MTEESSWVKITRNNPDHSHWYVDRFDKMEQAGADLGGEARFVSALVPLGSRVLDAGSGSGRVGSRIAAMGFDVVGVDIDPVLVETSQTRYPDSTWVVDDLATVNLADHGISQPFDAIVCAGNVMTFLAPESRSKTLAGFERHLRSGGRAAVGFGAGRGYDFGEFIEHSRDAGLVPELLLSSWDIAPLEADSNFLVALLRKP